MLRIVDKPLVNITCRVRTWWWWRESIVSVYVLEQCGHPTPPPL